MKRYFAASFVCAIAFTCAAAHGGSTVKVLGGKPMTARSATVKTAPGVLTNSARNATPAGSINTNSVDKRLSVSSFLNSKNKGIPKAISAGQTGGSGSGDDTRIENLESRLTILEQRALSEEDLEAVSGIAKKIASHTILGNNSGSSAEPMELTKPMVTAMLAGTDGESLMVGNDKRVVMTNHGVYRMKGKYYVQTPELPEPPEMLQLR